MITKVMAKMTRASLSEQRRVVLDEQNVMEVGLVTGDIFKVVLGTYAEMDDPAAVGPGGQVSFMVNDHTVVGGMHRLILTYAHHIQYLKYFVPTDYTEENHAGS
jgi:hypothetical protein